MVTPQAIPRRQRRRPLPASAPPSHGRSYTAQVHGNRPLGWPSGRYPKLRMGSSAYVWLDYAMIRGTFSL